MTVESDEWYAFATEKTEKLKTAEANVALQLALWEVALEETDTHTAKIAELQEQLAAEGAKLA